MWMGALYSREGMVGSASLRERLQSRACAMERDRSPRTQRHTEVWPASESGGGEARRTGVRNDRRSNDVDMLQTEGIDAGD